MKTINYLGLTGSILVIAGWLSPMLHLPIIGNWNYWGIDATLASIVLILAVAGMFGSVSAKNKLLKISGWATLVVVILTFIAVYFKVNDYFSFIPMKKLAAVAAKIVQFRWIGWILLIVGSVLMIFGGKKKEHTIE